MSAQHTRGRLRLFQVGDHLEFLCPATEDGESILTITHEGNTQFAVVLKDADARRLAACWNACEGISTEWLEKMPRPFGDLLSKPFQPKAIRGRYEIDELAEAKAQRDELLAALQRALPLIEDYDGKDGPEAVQARAAIAKVEASQ